MSQDQTLTPTELPKAARGKLTLAERIHNMFTFLYAEPEGSLCHFDKGFLDEVKAAAIRGATPSEKAHSEEKEFAAGMVLAAAFAIVDDMKWTTGMKDGDPHKGLGNYLADAVRSYREAR